MNPFISIVIPAYNAQKYIIEAVESCLTQDYDNFEVIVVDDKSTDKTMEYLLKYRDMLKPELKNRLVLICREQNGHTGAAMNTGITQMRGEWFKEMQADDILLPNALKDMIEEAQNHPNKEDTIFYANVYRIDKDGNIKFRFPETNRNDWSDLEFKAYLFQQNIGNGISVLIHKSALQKHGGFDTITKHEDYEMRLRWCIMEKCRMHLIDKFVASYREHPEQYTRGRTWDQMFDEDMRIKTAIIKQMSKRDQAMIAHTILIKNLDYFEDNKEIYESKTKLVDVLHHPKVLFWVYPSPQLLESISATRHKGESLASPKRGTGRYSSQSSQKPA